MKVDNEEIWNDYVKENKVKGFSIEGYFADKLNRPQDKQQDQLSEEEILLQKIIDVIQEQE